MNTDILSFLGLPALTRSLVFLGEAGCGKSELAVNLSLRLAEGDSEVHLFDLDMTKPLFRSRDLQARLARGKVALHYEEQFMDAPVLTGGVSRLLRDRSVYTVLDVGGDAVGARSVGGYAPLLNRPDTAVCYVINPFRAWSDTIEHIDRVLGETLGVSHVELPRLRLVGNPNLGAATTAEDVLAGYQWLKEQVVPYKDFTFFAAAAPLVPALEHSLPYPLLPLRLLLTYPWEEAQPTE